MEKILTSFSKSRSLPASLVKRSKQILLAARNKTNQAIAAEIDLHYNHVAVWQNRFLCALPALSDIESEKTETFEETIWAVFTDEQ